VEIEELITISVEATFETFVPKPVIVVTPTTIDLSSLTRPGQTMQVDVHMANHGLIAWRGVTIGFDDNSLYELKPLVEDVGMIPAQSEIIVPVVARYKGTTAAPSFRGRRVQKDSSDPCNLYGWVRGWYPCGPRQVNDATSMQGYWYCAPDPAPPPPPRSPIGPPTPPSWSTNWYWGDYSPIVINTEEKCCSASISGTSVGKPGDILGFTGTGGPAGGKYSWSTDNGGTILAGQGSSSVTVKLGGTPGTTTLRACI
jgi:hypothetical protein